MFVNVEKLCIAQSYFNEDVIGVGEKFAYCIDGATGLNQINILDKESDAKWFADKVKKELDILLLNESLSLLKILHIIMKKINDEINNKLIEKSIKNYMFPSAGIVIFRIINNNELEMYRLGDVLGIIKLINNDFLFLKDKNLEKLDKFAIDKQVKVAKEKNISVKEARKYINDILIKNRNLINKVGGYYALEPNGAGIDFGEYKVFDLDEIASVGLFSDGFYDSVDTFKFVNDYELLHDYMGKGFAKKIYNHMYITGENDLDYNKYPRFKLRDDASAVYLKIKGKKL